MLRRKRILFSEDDFHKDEKDEIIVVEKEERGLRKRQQVKYYENSSSEDDVEEIIEPKHSKKPRKESSTSNTDNSDFESEDSDDEETQKKSKSNKKETGKGQSSQEGKVESMSEYEKEMMEKKIKNLEFLKTIGMDEAKNDFLDLKPKRKVRVKKEPSESSNGPKRVSAREKTHVDFTEFFFKIEQGDNEELRTFKKVIKIKSDYEEFVEEFSEILEGDDILQTPVFYDKGVLKSLSMEGEIHYRRLYRPWEMSWYPSSEHLILAIAESNGCLSLCNVQESIYPYKFPVHTNKISNVQFNPYNTFQLLSSSLDGSMLCCDMQKQIFTEVLKNQTGCTYFDIFSPSCYLVSLLNGQALIVDRRSRFNRHKSYVLHDSSVNTIQVHPKEKNYFVTAGRDGKVRIWDSRKLSEIPLIENTVSAKSVSSAFFSPLSGKHLLVTSRDLKISIFDTTRISEGRMRLRKCLKYAASKKYLSFNCPTWLPNSDENFAWYDNKSESQKLQIYDTDCKVYDTVDDGIKGIRTFIEFHPFKPALASVTCTQSIRISASN